MKHKTSFGYHHRRNVFSRILVIIISIAVLSTCILAGSYIYMNIHIKNNRADIETYKQETKVLETEMQTAKEKEEQYKKQAEILSDQLTRYAPIVIPDSMKTK